MKKQIHPKLLQTKILAVSKDSPSGRFPLFKTLILMVGFISILSFSAKAQTYPKMHQGWSAQIEDATNHVEVSYMVTQCTSSSADSIYFMVFNEKPVADTVNLDITIYNQNKTDSTSKSVTLHMALAEMMIPECDKAALRNLVFPLPSGYDPEKSTIYIKFK